MTELTPPPAATATPHPSGTHPAAPPTGSSDNARLASRAVAITVAVLGAAGLLISGAGTAVAAVHESRLASAGTESVAVPTHGVDALDVDVARGDVRVVFADVPQAELTVTGERRGWTLERDGDTLSLASPASRFSWVGVDWFRGFTDDAQATLTLPQALQGVDLDVDLAAGRLVGDGDFGEITVDMGAGFLQLDGSATDVEATIGAGRAVLGLADVRTADLDLSAGRLDGDFTGRAPERVDIDVSAGSLLLALPDQPYAISVDRSAGSVETNELRTSSTAARTVDVTVSAGRVELRTN